MTKTNMDLSELLSKHDQGDLLRSIWKGFGLGLAGASCDRCRLQMARQTPASFGFR
ncbi:hypothetical protein [Pseudotabrizicola algicola]|uniref:Uncharacterized protein n=1 Tax=Pseudotabrizicola algicola TaxID=2709381 RepID=A0A6B3RZW5_9RHOB|nr:hypothetical protein [Pseudotabrizicola algicola]NEX48629.1 hypothetical protein [Pseudotabrizicola algicola]